MEESQGEAEKAHFPEQVRKYSKDHGTYKRIYARMAELLQYGRHEKQRRKAEQVAVSKDTNVYLPKTRKRKLMGLGMPEWAACEGAYSRKAYWRMANAGVVKRALTKERLINWGFYDLATAYQSMHVNY